MEVCAIEEPKLIKCLADTCDNENLCETCLNLFELFRKKFESKDLTSKLFNRVKSLINRENTSSFFLAKIHHRIIVEKIYLNYVGCSELLTMFEKPYKLGLPCTNLLGEAKQVEEYYEFSACVLCEHIALDPYVCNFCCGLYCKNCVDLILNATARMGYKLPDNDVNICIRRKCLIKYFSIKNKTHETPVFAPLTETNHVALYDRYYDNTGNINFMCRRIFCTKKLSPLEFCKHEETCNRGVIRNEITLNYFADNCEFSRSSEYDEYIASLDSDDPVLLEQFFPSAVKVGLKRARIRKLFEHLPEYESQVATVNTIIEFFTSLLKDDQWMYQSSSHSKVYSGW